MASKLGQKMVRQNNLRRGYSSTTTGDFGEAAHRKTMQGVMALRKFAKDMAGESGLAGIEQALNQRKEVIKKANQKNPMDYVSSNADEYKYQNYRKKARRALGIAERYTKQVMKRQK
jgi:hypothetical protein